MKNKYNIVLFASSPNRLWNAKSLGVYRLATEARLRGYTVIVIDYLNEWLQDHSALSNLIDTIISEQTKIVGFSSTFFSRYSDFNNVTNYKEYYNFQYNWAPWPANGLHIDFLIDLIKSKNNAVKIVYGGRTSYSMFELPSIESKVDYIVAGYAENTLFDILNRIEFKHPIKFKPTSGKAKLLDYDKLASNFDFNKCKTIFTKEDIITSTDILPLETSRGCLFKCSFCAFPLLGRKKGDVTYHRSTDNILYELKHNYEEFGVTKYMIVDDTFNETTSKIQSLLEIKNKSNIDIKFSAYLRTDLLHRFPEQIPLLKELGLQSAFLGIESLYEPSAKAIGKSTNPEKIKDTLYNMQTQWGSSVSLLGSFIIGLPEDNPTTLETWIPWILRTDCPLDSIIVHPLIINSASAESEISKNPEAFGYTIPNNISWTNKYWDQNLAREYALNVMTNAWESGRLRIGGWDILGLQSMGYSFEQLKNTAMKDLNYGLLNKIKLNQWDLYKNKVLN